MTVNVRSDVKMSLAAFDRAADECGLPTDVQQVMWDRLTAAAEPARPGVRNVAWRRYRTPFLLLPAAVAGWFLTMDLGDAVGGEQGSAPASLLVTALLLALAVRLDLRANDLRGEAFLLHLSGLASLSYALGTLTLPTGPRMLLVGLCGAACLAAGVWLARRVLLVFGASFAFSALAYLAYDVFGGSPVFALALGAIGVAIVVGGIRLDRSAGLAPTAAPALSPAA